MYIRNNGLLIVKSLLRVSYVFVLIVMGFVNINQNPIKQTRICELRIKTGKNCLVNTFCYLYSISAASVKFTKCEVSS